MRHTIHTMYCISQTCFCQVLLLFKLSSLCRNHPSEKKEKTVESLASVFSVFICHVIKTKNCNCSINKFKNLGYDRGLQYKQLCQESGLCCFSLVHYSQKCVTQVYRALYGEAMFVPFGGAGSRNVTKTSVIEFAIEMKIFALKLQHTEINASSSESTCLF